MTRGVTTPRSTVSMSRSTRHGAVSSGYERQDGADSGESDGPRAAGGGAAGAVAPRCPPRVGAARVPSLVKLTKLHDCDRCNFPQQTHRERVCHASDQVETKLKARFPPRRTAILQTLALVTGSGVSAPTGTRHWGGRVLTERPADLTRRAPGSRVPWVPAPCPPGESRLVGGVQCHLLLPVARPPALRASACCSGCPRCASPVTGLGDRTGHQAWRSAHGTPGHAS